MRRSLTVTILVTGDRPTARVPCERVGASKADATEADIRRRMNHLPPPRCRLSHQPHSACGVHTAFLVCDNIKTIKLPLIVQRILREKLRAA
jgi:hypothetical protein